MKCPNCHRDIPNGSNFCPYCRADLAMYNPNNQQPVYPTPNQVRNRPSSKNAKLIILIVSIVLLAVAVIAGGIILLLHNSSNDQAAVPTVSVEDAITREEWIAMLADKEGYTECKSDKSYFDDIDKSNDNYKKIQSCAEWGIIDKGRNFLPNDKATIDFAVTTAIKSIGINYISNNDKNISTDDEIIDYYKEKTGDYFSDKSYVDSNYANQILDNAKQIKDGITLKNSGSVSYKKGVKKAQPNEVKIKGKKATVSQKVKKGDILVIEPCDKYPSGKALKVKKVKGKKIEYTTPGLDEFLGEYSFAGEAAPTVTAVSSSDKDTTVKIKTTDAGNISAVSPAAVSPLALAGSESTTNTSGTNLFDYEIELSKEIGKAKISGTISLKNLVMRVDDFNAVGITVKNCNASLSYDIATKIKVSGKAEAKIPVRVDAKLFGVLGAAIKITVKVGLDGSVTVSSTTTITETMKYKMGAIPIFKQNVEKPNVDLQLKIKGYVNPEICIAGEVFNVDLFDFGGTVGLFNAEAAKNKYGCLDIKAYVPLELFINSDESALGKLKLKAKWIIWDSKSSKIQKSWHIESGKIVDKCTTPKPTTTKPAEPEIVKRLTAGDKSWIPLRDTLSADGSDVYYFNFDKKGNVKLKITGQIPKEHIFKYKAKYKVKNNTVTFKIKQSTYKIIYNNGSDVFGYQEDRSGKPYLADVLVDSSNGTCNEEQYSTNNRDDIKDDIKYLCDANWKSNFLKKHNYINNYVNFYERKSYDYDRIWYSINYYSGTEYSNDGYESVAFASGGLYLLSFYNIGGTDHINATLEKKNENEINVYFEYKGKSIYEVWSKGK